MSQIPPSMPMGMGGAMRPHRGVLILILGILGFFCLFLAIAAWIMGKGDLAAMDAGQMDPSGRGLTNAGKILGMIFTILAVIGLLLQILLMVLGGGAGTP